MLSLPTLSVYLVCGRFILTVRSDDTETSPDKLLLTKMRQILKSLNIYTVDEEPVICSKAPAAK